MFSHGTTSPTRRSVKAFQITCLTLLVLSFAQASACAGSAPTESADSNAEATNAFTPIRVAAGYTTGFTDSLGNVWSADKDFTGGVAGLDAGHAVAKTSTPGIYDGQRFGDTTSTNDFAYNFAVPAGSYTVTLKFTENYVTGPGQRLFNVSIDGKRVLTNFDIYAATGGQWIAVDENFPVSLSAAGTINITFSAGSVQSPKVDAIQIVSTTFTPIRVAAGYTTGFTDPLGNVWNADEDFTGGLAGLNAGQAVANTSTPDVYDGQRFGDATSTNSFAYNFALPAGSYTVTLKFTENYVTGAGQRLFNVSIDRTQVLTNFVIYAASGGQWRAIDRSFPVSMAAAGTINIAFTPGSIQSPKVDAIQILASTSPGDGGIHDSGGADSQTDSGTCTGTCYTVTVNGAHASTAPSGSVRVGQNKTQSFTVTANTNYELSSSSPLTVQGTCPMGAVPAWSNSVLQTGVLTEAVYTTGPITADCSVTFLATSAIVTIPAAAKATNVTAPPYNADKSGNCANATATTAAFNHAILDAFEQERQTPGSSAGLQYDDVVYVPAGTYCINGPINPGGGVSSVTIQGAGVGQTIIQLEDSSGLKGAVITTNDASQPSCSTGCNTAFRNDINDLTINTGRNNPNATGISYLANNNGEVRNVSIVSVDGQGAVGFDGATSINGPALVKNLYVQGFTTGVLVGGNMYSLVFEHLQVKDQQSVGVRVESTSGVLAIRDLDSSQNISTVPAVQSQDPNNVLTLIDSTLRNTAGGAAVDAIVNSGAIFVRNTTQNGYSALVSGLSCGNECESPAATKINGGPETTSLNLPIEETPYYNDTDTTWIDVTSGPFCGSGTSTPCATPNNTNVDSAKGINAALASAPPGTTAFVKQGLYFLNEPITIPQNVVRLVCYGATFTPYVPYSGSAVPTFRFNATSKNSLQILEGCNQWNNFVNGGGITFLNGGVGSSLIENNSPGTVVLKDMDSYTYSNTQQSWGGTVFLENMIYGPFKFTNQTVYCRQCDPEYVSAPEPHVSVMGGMLWILGYKQEGTGPAFSLSNGLTTARVEVLGGAIHAGGGEAGPMIINNSARMSASGFATGIAYNGGDVSTWIRETQSGKCASGCSLAAPNTRQDGSDVSLYVGYP